MKEKVREAIRLDVPVRRYVTKKLIAVEKGTSIQESAGRMVEFDISSLAVVEKGKVTGFITDSDIKKRVVAGGVDVREPIDTVMTTDLITADINTGVGEIMEIMAENTIKHVLITEGEKTVGVITMRDIEDVSRRKLETYIARE
jgi:CBS domain-containing protein